MTTNKSIEHQFSTASVFETIYKLGGWGSPESKSGTGSTIAATIALQYQIPLLFRMCQTASVLDVKDIPNL